ncbi:hypothetical protein HPS56_06890 [Prevotella sp. PMUR]|uniref:Uncharacterized protein n=1 Tax=Xylanibacter muris TaxID=2736290 RepID=A0ABX2AQ73_9BACT|nr:hypothetical protein [Xylanibacter muris]NPD92081.1 hypothetical protein [Xylanibacter muris]
MDGIKHSRQFAEIERLVSDYFQCHLAPVMSKTQAYLTKKQGEEMKEYSTSLGGILSMMASSAQPMSDPYHVLKVTGEWNSKKTEDYIEMCKDKISKAADIQQDLAYLAGKWRDSVVQEVGRERYDALSEQLGGDLAYAYMDYRVEQLMIDKLVKERMPKSSADYIIRKAAQSSLLGLSQTLSRSPLAEEIEARGEAAYRPSKLEKGAGHVLGASADAVMMGGVGSWASLAKFIGADVAISAVASRFEPKKPETLSVEQCISKGVFGSRQNVFDGFRKEAATIQTGKSELITATNEQLKKKIPVLNFDFSGWMHSWNNNPFGINGFSEFKISGFNEKEHGKDAPRYKNVPLVVAPGQEEAYLNDLAKKKSTSAKTKPEQTQPEAEHREKVETEEPQPVISPEKNIPGEQMEQANTNGWSGLFGMLGLNGMGDITGNLGYVMAMLPDILLGAFTGKTQSLRFGDNLLPIASIVAGIFVRNPLLKMLLVGLGGANLLNKAGHEVLQGRAKGKLNEDAGHDMQYRRYADEPLNPRIVNPILQGSTLITTIDRVPCTIQLTPTVADAYRAGALPLNTLANAVLAKSDQLRRIASQNYDDGQQETIVRTRGIQ